MRGEVVGRGEVSIRVIGMILRAFIYQSARQNGNGVALIANTSGSCVLIGGPWGFVGVLKNVPELRHIMRLHLIEMLGGGTITQRHMQPTMTDA